MSTMFLKQSCKYFQKHSVKFNKNIMYCHKMICNILIVLK